MNAGYIQSQDAINIQSTGRGKMRRRLKQISNIVAVENATLTVTC